jgi:hypothetical protein
MREFSREIRRVGKERADSAISSALNDWNLDNSSRRHGKPAEFGAVLPRFRKPVAVHRGAIIGSHPSPTVSECNCTVDEYRAILSTVFNRIAYDAAVKGKGWTFNGGAGNTIDGQLASSDYEGRTNSVFKDMMSGAIWNTTARGLAANAVEAAKHV